MWAHNIPQSGIGCQYCYLLSIEHMICACCWVSTCPCRVGQIYSNCSARMSYICCSIVVPKSSVCIFGETTNFMNFMVIVYLYEPSFVSCKKNKASSHICSLQNNASRTPLLRKRLRRSSRFQFSHFLTSKLRHASILHPNYPYYSLK